jgi:hypothetical protein
LKLARNEPENAQQIGAAIAIHSGKDLSPDYPELLCGNASGNAVEGCGESGRNGTGAVAILAAPGY